MTTALVLAAGLGRRLESVTSGPKWLVPVAGTSPMAEQLAAFASVPSIDRVVVVVSPDASAVADAVAGRDQDRPIALVENPDAARWNNWSSALVGFEDVGDSGVVLINSDLFASRTWLATAIDTLVRRDGPALVIDGERPLTDEAMKVAGAEWIHSIGKTSVDAPSGEYVGISWWPAGSAGNITSILRSYREVPEAAQNWYEHAIAADMSCGTGYARVDTPSTDWVEIDDENDHRAAERLLATDGWG